MAQRALDLAREQRPVVAEIPFEGVPVEHDPVLVAFAGQPVAEVLAVGSPLAPELRDDHRHLLEQTPEFLRQRVDRVRHQGFELLWPRLIHCEHVKRQTLEVQMRSAQPTADRKLRALATAFALLAIVAGGVVWSGCGSSSTESSINKAKEEAETSAKKAEEAVGEGAEKSKKRLEEAKEELEKTKGKASENFEKRRKEAEEKLEEVKEKAEEEAGK